MLYEGLESFISVPGLGQGSRQAMNLPSCWPYGPTPYLVLLATSTAHWYGMLSCIVSTPDLAVYDDYRHLLALVTGKFKTEGFSPVFIRRGHCMGESEGACKLRSLFP